jgi:hypothetical protein
VQDSNLRRHTPTDLQTDAAHAVTCGFTTSPPNFRTSSARDRPQLGGRSRRRFPDQGLRTMNNWHLCEVEPIAGQLRLLRAPFSEAPTLQLPAVAPDDYLVIAGRRGNHAGACAWKAPASPQLSLHGPTRRAAWCKTSRSARAATARPWASRPTNTLLVLSPMPLLKATATTSPSISIGAVSPDIVRR